jgi:hypothetical protein
MVFEEGDDYRALRRPGDDPAQFRSPVRPVQVPEAPDSVIHQYRGENFDAKNNVWPDSVGTANMDTTGLQGQTFKSGALAVSSDGVDDNALSSVTPGSGPESLLTESQFGIAMVYEAPASPGAFLGHANSTGSRLLLLDVDGLDGSLGELELDLQDDSDNRLNIQTTASFANAIHLVVINKTSNSTVNFYVDDMAQSGGVPTTTNRNQGFDNTNITIDEPMVLFARSFNGAAGFEKEMTASLFEFNEQPYSQQDRLNLKQRAPGL